MTGNIIGRNYVELGLPSGTKWATDNVGAAVPEGYGDYFAWGETSTKETYNRSTYRYSNGGEVYNLTKYCNNAEYGYNGFTDALTTLEVADDAAAVNWGSGWRMPTVDEIQERENECTSSRGISTLNGVAGQLITGPNGNSIFLAFAGRRYSIPTNPSLNIYDVGTVGEFWSGTFREQSKYYYGAYTLTTGYPSLSGHSDRYHGLPIRPVKSK